MKSSLFKIGVGVLSTGIVLSSCTSHRSGGESEMLEAQAGSAILEYEPGSYERVFDLTRERLMDYRFAIDRVDARRGVITTHPKRTSGLASPWDQEQSSLSQEWEDLINEHRRVVRVEFDRQATPPTARFTVELLRTHRPNWRVESESVRLSTHARSRDALGQTVPGSHLERVGLDERFAVRLAESIGQDLYAGITDATVEP